jgi:antitoxin CptB
MTTNNSDFSKLKWACRRGMLELDVLLGNFLDEAYLSLSPEDKKHFEELLSYPDPELFAFLLGSETPDDPDMASITTMIRQHAKSRI